MLLGVSFESWLPRPAGGALRRGNTPAHSAIWSQPLAPLLVTRLAAALGKLTATAHTGLVRSQVMAARGDAVIVVKRAS